jgi:hypothetical protein
VVFELNGESYGVENGRVQEIDRIERVTALPQAPAYAEGIINLRGQGTLLETARGLNNWAEVRHCQPCLTPTQW